MVVVLLILSLICGVFGFIFSLFKTDEKDEKGEIRIYGILGGFLLGLMCFFLSETFIEYMEQHKEKEPTSMDVYRGNTSLLITYKDSIPLDTQVVFKNYKYKKVIKK